MLYIRTIRTSGSAPVVLKTIVTLGIALDLLGQLTSGIALVVLRQL